MGHLFWIIIVVVFVIANGLYLWRLLSTPFRMRCWLEANGWRNIEIVAVRRDSRWYESDTWWKCRVVAQNDAGETRQLVVRTGGILQSIAILEDLPADDVEKKER